MNRGIKVKVEDLKDFEEYVTSIIYSLCKYSEGTDKDRILNKFKQKNFEKLARLIELHKKYEEKVNTI